MKKILNATLVTLSMLFSLQADAGVVIGGTRVIFEEGKKEASLQVQNPDNIAYLIQSWAESEHGKNDKSFIVTPPLFRLDAKQNNRLRILTGRNSFPADRESLYWLNVKAIPSSQKAEGKNSLQLAIRTRIKMIYRPTALKAGAPEQHAAQLSWKREGNNLVVTNPSGYYMNFQSVSIGGKALTSATYVAPGSKATFTVAPDIRGNAVEWKVLNDFGVAGPAHHAPL